MWPLQGEEGVGGVVVEEGGGEETEGEGVVEDEERWTEVVETGAGDPLQDNKQ